MKPIDLRSDTVTQPTDAMRTAMARAEVGDDVFEEDPTLKRLEKTAAEKVGKEAALFVPSGTMANLVSVLAHCRRGDEILLGDRSHIFINEVGGVSALGGVHPHPLPNAPDGTLPLKALEAAIRGPDIHYPPTRLLCLENTHNYCMGSPLTPEYTRQVADLASRYDLQVHLDGARMFNAAVALNRDVKELAAPVDSLMFSLSKGLSAPVGSLVCGRADFIRVTRKLRKMVGGGMRQAGHLAAAGLVALDELRDRLKDDHARARKLAAGLSEMEGIRIDLDRIQTNILFFELTHPQMAPESFLNRLQARGIQILLVGPGVFRAVLHRQITEDHVHQVLQAVRQIVAEPKTA